MKISILILIAVIFTSCAPRQSSLNSPSIHKDNPKIDTTFFILGTLSEQNGRYWQINKPDQLDRYNVFEEPMVDFLRNLSFLKYKSEFKILKDNTSPSSDFETFSKELSVLLNSYYTESGKLTDSILSTSDQMYSYLLGRYFRYGRQANDSIYLIHLFNFPNHTICNNLLRKTCRKVFLKQIKEMPAQFIYYFIPNPEFMDFLNTFSDQKLKLTISYDTFMRNLWGVTETEYFKTMNNIHEKELSEIIINF
jgi:hypothetical protein